MGLLLMTNGQMGISSLGKNETFILDYRRKGFPVLNSWKPVFGAGLKSKNVKRVRGFVVRKRCCGTIYAMVNEESDKRVVGGGGGVGVEGGMVEREFEFKPSFSEYLKAMESVKSERRVQQASKLSRERMRDALKGKYMLRTTSLGKDDEKVKLMDEEVVSKDVGREELGRNGHGVARGEGLVRGKFDRKGSVIRKSKDKFSGNESWADAKMKRTSRGETEGRSSKDVGREELGGNGDGVARGEGLVRGKFDRKGSVIRKSKDKSSGNESWADAKVKRTSRGETEGRRWSRNQTNSEEPELKDSYLYKVKKFQKARDGPVVLLNDNGSGNTVNITADLVHGKSSSEMFGRKGKALKGTKLVVEAILKSFPEKDDNRSWEMERAAFKFVEEGNDFMDKPRVPRVDMEERIQKLGRQLNGADIDVPEWMFSKMMRSARIRFSDHSILRVIQILGKLGNWRRVLQVIEWLQMRERYQSHRLKFIYTTALNVLGKARRPVEALNVFHAMQQQMSSYPDLVAYHSIAVTLGQAGHIRELFDVIDCMRSLPKKKFKTGIHERWDPRLEPDIVVYNAVLNACVKRKHWEGAFWVLQQLKEKGQKPSASTYGLVMEVMLACGKYNLVHDFFRKVQKSFIPNALVYKVLVNTLWREGKIDEAVLAVQDMERRGIVGSAALYYDLARLSL
ncbi:hypothetical protein Pint_11376 [Pistacia integerrima]|uniref:Uncharacterized protein n=1 Tax=Pistacia integerrima TaxID=434235 RepID=A0ACC0XFT1_9ROSI|nr:hypothetical protein Pint_11376 [Pistacia integerrima]